MARVRVERTNRARGIRVRVLLGGEVVVTAGKAVTDAEIASFLSSHRRWLNSHIASMRDKAEYLDRYASGDIILLHGREYPVRYECGHGISHFDGSAVIIYTTGNRVEALERWYSTYARQYLVRMFHDIAGDICPVSVKRVRSYYGICYTGKAGSHIHLNIALVHADDECIRYVIHHEMAHLVVANHSKDFYREIERLEPHYSEIESRLRALVKIK